MNYELDFLTPNLDTKEKEDLLKTIEEKIKKLNGTIQDQLIKKRLFAYPVKKQRVGFLGVTQFTIEGSKIKELNDFLKMNENILRIMIEKKQIGDEKNKFARKRRRPILEETKTKTKKDKVKIEELDKKLDELLK
ncbi:MAG TPA: 30S ribosomal protein S6 [Candidatus Paceibacterota bacterium]|nr:30S ribosomal protein S6 [Candidatus Paceibacterota bacterium]